jgi:hypothetical protein
MSLTAPALMAGVLSLSVFDAAPARAWDETAYLFNVFLRPGYNFDNADEALGYGYDICRKVEQGTGYARLVAEVKTDRATVDEFQASYLISQAANELCPQLVWQLRNSSAGYRPTSG